MVRQPEISWEKAMGTASCKWVRPVVTSALIVLFQLGKGSRQLVQGRQQVVLEL